MYVAKRPLLFGDRVIQPGEAVPVEASRRYDILLEAGDIEEVPDPPRPAPAVHLREAVDKLAAALAPEPKWVCGVCGKTFSSESRRKVHISRMHWRP